MITDEIPGLAGQHLTLAHLSAGAADEPVVVNEAGELVSAVTCPRAQLLVSRRVTLADGREVTVKSSFRCLKESAEKLTMAQYGQRCGVPEEKSSPWRTPLPATDAGRRLSPTAE